MTEQKNTRRLTVLSTSLASLGLIGTICATQALAHHGFTGRYNLSQPIVLQGRVISANWAPPHVTIQLRVEGRDTPPSGARFGVRGAGAPLVRGEDLGQIRTIEFPPISQYFGMRGDVNVGDRVMVVAFQNCDTPNQLRSQWIRLADGKINERRGLQIAGAVAQCTPSAKAR